MSLNLVYRPEPTPLACVLLDRVLRNTYLSVEMSAVKLMVG